VDPRPRPTAALKMWQRWESNPGLLGCCQELWPLDHRGAPSAYNPVASTEKQILKIGFLAATTLKLYALTLLDVEMQSYIKFHLDRFSVS
jgi:hypothetical protein